MGDKTPKILGAVAHSPPAPAPVLLVPVMVAQEPNQEERWLLQVSPGKWRHMTTDDLVTIVLQLDKYDAARVRDAAIKSVGESPSPSARDEGDVSG